MGGCLVRLMGTAILVVALAGAAFADDQSPNGRGRGRGRGRGHDGGPTTTSDPSQGPEPSQAPEIDLSTGIDALALLAGGLIVIRGRRQANRE